MIPVEIENARLKLALTIPTGAPITVANDAIETLPVVIDKTINDLSKQSKEAIYLLSLLLINSDYLTDFDSNLGIYYWFHKSWVQPF